jgi:hypothetical protein
MANQHWLCVGFNPIAVKPLLCEELDEPLKQQIWERDGGQCCVSQLRLYDGHDPRPSFACILAPSLFENLESNENVGFQFIESRYVLTSFQARFRRLLEAYVGEETLQTLTLLAAQNCKSDSRYTPEQLATFSPQIFDHFVNGRLSLRKGLNDNSTSVRNSTSVEIPLLITSRLDTSWRRGNLCLRSN